jgi:hypothetical protein
VYEGNFLATDYTDDQMSFVMSSEVETSLDSIADQCRHVKRMTNDEEMTKFEYRICENLRQSVDNKLSVNSASSLVKNNFAV